jgi:hypothetical protein
MPALSQVFTNGSSGFIKPGEWLNKVYEWAKKIVETPEKQKKDAV